MPVAVQFSGHSHGGQSADCLAARLAKMVYTAIPLRRDMARRYPIGLRSIGDQQVYTNRGLGVWPVPFRLNCRPEISLFTLLPTCLVTGAAWKPPYCVLRQSCVE